MSKLNENESIKLSLPVNAAYVSAARLTASSIAFRMGFEIDAIEDIKAAVSEACAFIIKKSSPSTSSYFKITFNLDQEFLDIAINLENSIVADSIKNEISLTMIEALVDNLEIVSADEKIAVLKMKKFLRKENLFLGHVE